MLFVGVTEKAQIVQNTRLCEARRWQGVHKKSAHPMATVASVVVVHGCYG